jgi:membrane fusion protein, multidrug efflux system
MPPQDSAQRLTDATVLPAASRRRKIIGAAVAVLLMAGLGVLTWYLTTRPAATSAAAGAVPGGPGGPGGAGGPGNPGGSGRGATTVGVATAEKATVPVTLEALGTVTPLATVKVRPQVAGVLEKVLFTEGQMVKKGDLLAVIDSRQYELAVQQAVGQRQRDAAQLESAKVTLERFKTLLSQDSIARQEVDSQAALVKQLEGSMMVNQSAVGVAQLNLTYARVVAPISGRVGLRTVDIGNAVSPSDANGLVVITQVAPIDVVFSVPQDRIADVQSTSTGSSQVMAFDRTRSTVLATGTFASLDNQIDTTTGTVKAKARFANTAQALFPSQFVNIQLQIKSIDNAVVVPVSAVRLGGSGDFVYVLNAAERTVSVRPVTRAQVTAEKVVIASGLKAGEQVITEGADRLKDGARVSLAGDAPRGAGRRQGASAPGGAAGSSAAASAAAFSASAAPAASASANPSAGAAVAAPAAPAPAPSARPAAALPAPAAAGPAAVADNKPATTAAAPLPSAEQRQRMLDQIKDDPVAFERRKKFFEKLDSGDAEALQRWQAMAERRRQGGGAGGGERAAQ